MADMVAITMVGGAMASWRPSPEETRRTANSKSCRGTGLAKSRLVPVPVDQECRNDEGRAAAAGSVNQGAGEQLMSFAPSQHSRARKNSRNHSLDLVKPLLIWLCLHLQLPSTEKLLGRSFVEICRFMTASSIEGYCH